MQEGLKQIWNWKSHKRKKKIYDYLKLLNTYIGWIKEIRLFIEGKGWK